MIGYGFEPVLLGCVCVGVLEKRTQAIVGRACIYVRSVRIWCAERDFDSGLCFAFGFSPRYDRVVGVSLGPRPCAYFLSYARSMVSELCFAFGFCPLYDRVGVSLGPWPCLFFRYMLDTCYRSKAPPSLL